ncbi:hypothetical protein LINPERPRIM_LOCUS11718 [Linum perenne]
MLCLRRRLMVNSPLPKLRKGSLVYGMRTSPSLNPRSTVSHVSYVDKWFHLSLSLEEFVSGGERESNSE